MNYRAGDTIDNRYTLEKHIGSGGFADVYKAKDNMTEAIIAIKIYNSMDESGVAIFQKEYLKMSDLNHNRLLTAHYFGVYEASPYLIMPLCKFGNLTRLLVDENNFLTEKKLATILLQVAEGLEYLHKNGIVHQDIKPDNILERKEEEYVLSDFGISQRARSTLQKSIRRTEKLGSGSGYTPAYAPPTRERLSTRASSSKDIFSLGATLYELSAKELPYFDMGEAVQNDLEIPDIENGYSNEWNSLLKSCLLLNPEKRPTATDLKEMARHFFSEGIWILKKNHTHVSPKATSPVLIETKVQPTPVVSSSQPKKQKQNWIALLIIPVLGLIGWGIFQMNNNTEQSTTSVPKTKTTKSVPTKKDRSQSLVASKNEFQGKGGSVKIEKNQKKYDDIIASAERNFKRGNYERSLKKFESAKGLVEDDHKAIDGIEKCNNKVSEIEIAQQIEINKEIRREEARKQAEAEAKRRADAAKKTEGLFADKEKGLGSGKGSQGEPIKNRGEIDTKVYKVVEEMPRFPGCEDKGLGRAELKKCAEDEMLKFIYSNIKYPAVARENGIEGRAILQFIVQKDGSIKDVKVLRDPGGGTGMEAERVIKLMNDMPTKWIPGKQRGKPVRVQYALPVSFKLQG